MSEQHECWWVIRAELKGKIIAECNDPLCPGELDFLQISRRLNKYEPLKEELAQIKHDSQRLLNAVVCSPVYHKVKDAYSDLKRAVDILEGK